MFILLILRSYFYFQGLFLFCGCCSLLLVFFCPSPFLLLIAANSDFMGVTPSLTFQDQIGFLFFFFRHAGLSLLWPLPLRSTGSRCAGSAAMAHGPSRAVARGILPDRGTNPCPLHRQADSQPLRHQGSPENLFLNPRNPSGPCMLTQLKVKHL